MCWSLRLSEKKVKAENQRGFQILRVLVQILHNPEIFRLSDNLGKKLLTLSMYTCRWEATNSFAQTISIWCSVFNRILASFRQDFLPATQEQWNKNCLCCRGLFPRMRRAFIH
jgi:hypothetical protein